MATALWGLPHLGVSDSCGLGFVRFCNTQGHCGSVSMNLFITNCYKLLLVKQIYLLKVTAELLTVKKVYTYHHVRVCTPIYMYLLCVDDTYWPAPRSRANWGWKTSVHKWSTSQSLESDRHPRSRQCHPVCPRDLMQRSSDKLSLWRRLSF